MNSCVLLFIYERLVSKVFSRICVASSKLIFVFLADSYKRKYPQQRFLQHQDSIPLDLPENYTNKEEALKILPLAFAAVDKAAKRGVIKKNTAARKKSRLSRIVK